jgi:RNA polymerase primary sigma factor
MEAEFLEEAIERLPERTRYVLVRRYGLDGREPATLVELGYDMGISRERVRQLQREAEQDQERRARTSSPGRRVVNAVLPYHRRRICHGSAA